MRKDDCRTKDCDKILLLLLFEDKTRLKML
uniref:Uncharacterized protein n=1 Tax=Anopheles funestus TaxID=62324 RepID=A0A182S446_ANOFN